MYKNICQSLFERDKLLFSFIVASQICELDKNEFRFLLTGGVTMYALTHLCDLMESNTIQLIHAMVSMLMHFNAC